MALAANTLVTAGLLNGSPIQSPAVSNRVEDAYRAQQRCCTPTASARKWI